jgi:hypothetical protein
MTKPLKTPDTWLETYAVLRDAVLILTGIIVAIRLVWTENGDPALIGLAVSLIGAGSYGRAIANGKK